MFSTEELDNVSDCIDDLSQINPVKENLIIENKAPEDNIIKLKLCNKLGEIVREIEPEKEKLLMYLTCQKEYIH